MVMVVGTVPTVDWSDSADYRQSVDEVTGMANHPDMANVELNISLLTK